jgi:hypothetical protein
MCYWRCNNKATTTPTFLFDSQFFLTSSQTNPSICAIKMHFLSVLLAISYLSIVVQTATVNVFPSIVQLIAEGSPTQVFKNTAGSTNQFYVAAVSANEGRGPAESISLFPSLPSSSTPYHSLTHPSPTCHSVTPHPNHHRLDIQQPRLHPPRLRKHPPLRFQLRAPRLSTPRAPPMADRHLHDRYRPHRLQPLPIHPPSASKPQHFLYLDLERLCGRRAHRRRSPVPPRQRCFLRGWLD